MKKWKEGDTISCEYLNNLETENENLRKEIEALRKKSSSDTTAKSSDKDK